MALSLQNAQRLVNRAVEAAQAQNLPIAAVVLDTGGHVVASARMDGVGYYNYEIARRKAISVVTVKMATHELVDAISRDDLIQRVLYAEQGLCVLPGGFPVRQGEEVVGALGIAGGMYFQDRAIGEYAVAEG